MADLARTDDLRRRGRRGAEQQRRRRLVPRRRGPYDGGQSWVGLWLSWTGAVVGVLAAVAAVLVGLFAIAYAEGRLRVGGYDYGCSDAACALGHTLAGVLCFASIAVYVVLVVTSVLGSTRLLRAGMRLGWAWALAVVISALLLNVAIGWLWLGLLAAAPALMAWGARRRLRAKETGSE
ncbi:MAG: hypothetical protein PVG27_11275 [Chloroflexota bacterium]